MHSPYTFSVRPFRLRDAYATGIRFERMKERNKIILNCWCVLHVGWVCVCECKCIWVTCMSRHLLSSHPQNWVFAHKQMRSSMAFLNRPNFQCFFNYCHWCCCCYDDISRSLFRLSIIQAIISREWANERSLKCARREKAESSNKRSQFQCSVCFRLYMHGSSAHKSHLFVMWCDGSMGNSANIPCVQHKNSFSFSPRYQERRNEKRIMWWLNII